MNKVIKISIIGIFLISLTTGCGCERQEIEEEPKVNVNEDVIKDQKVEVFQFTNTSLIYEEGNSVLETVVTNTSNETQYLEEFKIHVKNIEGTEIVTMTGFIGDSIEAKESKTIISTYGEDLTNATSIEYEIVKS